MFRHLLVPVDAGDLEDGAAARAVELARSLGARVTFLHTLASVPLDTDAAIIGAPQALDPTLQAQVNQVEAAEAGSILERAQALARAAGVESAARVGDEPLVVDGILRALAACGCDLVVMGCHGRRGWLGLLHGHQSQRLIPRCPVPVLVLPEAGASGAGP